jgi:hypothetical protein
MTELWEMKWMGYAACMAENRKEESILVGKTLKKQHYWKSFVYTGGK